MSRIVSPDSFVRYVPFGFVFRDSTDLSIVADGLDVTVTDADLPQRFTRLSRTPSGIWMSPRLPGLGIDASEAPETWPTKARPFVVQVTDRHGRFLPLRFTAALPYRGRFVWPGWKTLEPELKPLHPPGAASVFVPDYLPLFPSVARTAPGPRATVCAHLILRESGETDRVAAWAAATLTVDGRIMGIGVADSGGALAISFPYPTLPVQPPEQAKNGRNEIAWKATFSVHHEGLGKNPEETDDPGDAVPPELSDILGQLAKPPKRALEALGPPAKILPPQDLVLGRPLILATDRTDKERFSSLYLEPA